MKKGDIVTWSSQSKAHRTVKTGQIIEVVLPGNQPKKYCPNGGPMGCPRNHRSYVVKVGSKTYWPLVRHLVRRLFL